METQSSNPAPPEMISDAEFRARIRMLRLLDMAKYFLIGAVCGGVGAGLMKILGE